MKRRDFLKKAGVGAAAVAATAVNAPFVHGSKKKTTIKVAGCKRYAGCRPLAAHVCKPAIDAFNKVANGRNGDRLLRRRPAGAHRRAVQGHAAAPSMPCRASSGSESAAPVDVSIFGGYFPLAHARPGCPRCCSISTGSTRSGKRPTAR